MQNQEQLAALEEVSLDEPVTVWMNSTPGYRLGVRPEQAEASSSSPDPVQKRSVKPVNIVSDLARALEKRCGADRETTPPSFIPFAKANLVNVPLPRLAGILLWRQSRDLELGAPGSLLYGVSLLGRSLHRCLILALSASDVRRNLQPDRCA